MSWPPRPRRGDSKLLQPSAPALYMCTSKRLSPLECCLALSSHVPAQQCSPRLSVSSTVPPLNISYIRRFVANITAELRKNKPCEGAISRELMERELAALNRDRGSLEKKLGLLLSSFAGGPCGCGRVIACSKRRIPSNCVGLASPSRQCSVHQYS